MSIRFYKRKIRKSKQNLHGPKLLGQNTIHIGLNINRHLVGLYKGHDITVIDFLTNLNGPFNNCTLSHLDPRKADMHEVLLVPIGQPSHLFWHNHIHTSVIESPMEGTWIVFFSNNGKVADTKLLEDMPVNGDRRATARKICGKTRVFMVCWMGFGSYNGDGLVQFRKTRRVGCRRDAMQNLSGDDAIDSSSI